VIRWLNGDSWIGRFLAEEETGESEGVMTFAETGDTLKGHWSDISMRNGKGEMTMWIKADDREVKGEWIDGSFHRQKQEEEEAVEEVLSITSTINTTTTTVRQQQLRPLRLILL